MDERNLAVLKRVAQGVTDNEFPPCCNFCYSFLYYKDGQHLGHGADCETVLARNLLTELGETW
jgi:hypothetical protein